MLRYNKLKKRAQRFLNFSLIVGLWPSFLLVPTFGQTKDEQKISPETKKLIEQIRQQSKPLKKPMQEEVKLFKEAMGLLRKSWIEGKGKKYEEMSVQKLKAVLKKNPEYLDPYAVLVRIHDLTGKCQEAKKLSDKLIELEVRGPINKIEQEVSSNIQQAFFVKGCLEDASKKKDGIDKKIFQSHKERFFALYELGKARYKKFEKALEEADTLISALNSKKEDLEKALKLLKKAYKMYPYVFWVKLLTARTYANLSYEYVKSNQCKIAMKMAYEGLKYDPQNPWLYAYLGDCYEKQNDTSKALRLYQKALKIDPENMGAQIGLDKLDKKHGKNL